MRRSERVAGRGRFTAIVDSGPIPDLRRHLEVVTLTAIMAMPTPAQRVHVAVAVSELLDGMMEGMADGVVLEF
jgi:hypothetical protein